MSPYAKSLADFSDRGCSQEFDQIFLYHLNNGFVFSTPTFFVMGEAVNKDEYPRNPFGCKKDAWFIAAFAGDLKNVWSILPYELPWIGFGRSRDPEKELRFISLSEIRRLSGFTDDLIKSILATP